ncbi:MDIS1-interacting receptor like kinase 2-like protein [Tanacetum coccineum]
MPIIGKNWCFLKTDFNLFSVTEAFTASKPMKQIQDVRDDWSGIHANHEHCNLEGNIREQIGMLLNLPHLSLRGNYLKGTLPVSLNLTKLLVLNLSRNNFTSTIPSQIGNLKNLLHLNLKDSQFSCLIPSSLGSMVNLTYLDLSRNNFIGRSLPLACLDSLLFFVSSKQLVLPMASTSNANFVKVLILFYGARSKRDTSIVLLKCTDTKLDRAESKVEKTEYLLHELYQKKFVESEPSAIEELDKSIYDCQVALGECITKVEVLR